MKTSAILVALVMTVLPVVGCAGAETEEGESTDQAVTASDTDRTGYVMGRLDVSAAKVASATEIVVTVGCPNLAGEVTTVHPQQDPGASPVYLLRVARPGRCEVRLSDGKRTGTVATVVATDHQVWGYNDFAVDAKLSLTRR